MRIKPFGRRMARAIAPLFVMLTLTSCAARTDSVATEPITGAENFCRIAKPITWSSRDTDETIREVKAHNAAGVALCGWKGD